MGFLEKGIILYVMLALAACLSFPSVIFNTGNGVVTPLNWVNIGVNSSDNNRIYYNPGQYALTGDASGFADNTSLKQAPPSGYSVFQWIDGLNQIWGWIGVIFKMLFAPIVVIGAIAGWGSALMLFAIPLTIGFLMGLIYFIRSGQ